MPAIQWNVGSLLGRQVCCLIATKKSHTPADLVRESGPRVAEYSPAFGDSGLGNMRYQMRTSGLGRYPDRPFSAESARSGMRRATSMRRHHKPTAVRSMRRIRNNSPQAKAPQVQAGSHQARDRFPRDELANESIHLAYPNIQPDHALSYSMARESQSPRQPDGREVFQLRCRFRAADRAKATGALPV